MSLTSPTLDPALDPAPGAALVRRRTKRSVTLTNGLVLLGVSDIWQYIIKGIVIIGAVALDRYRQSGART